MRRIKIKATTINAMMMRKFCFPPDRLIISFVFCVTKSNRCVVLSRSVSISSSILQIGRREGTDQYRWGARGTGQCDDHQRKCAAANKWHKCNSTHLFCCPSSSDIPNERAPRRSALLLSISKPSSCCFSCCCKNRMESRSNKGETKWSKLHQRWHREPKSTCI